MDLSKIADLIRGNEWWLAIVLLSLIQITPIKVNPWSALFKWIGKLLNGEIMNEIKSIKTDLNAVHTEIDAMQKKQEAKEADAARNRILRFDDELRLKIDHSQEYFDQMLLDIDFYRGYCEQNRGYPNSKAEDAMNHIIEVYHECKSANKFI